MEVPVRVVALALEERKVEVQLEEGRAAGQLKVLEAVDRAQGPEAEVEAEAEVQRPPREVGVAVEAIPVEVDPVQPPEAEAAVQRPLREAGVAVEATLLGQVVVVEAQPPAAQEERRPVVLPTQAILPIRALALALALGLALGLALAPALGLALGLALRIRLAQVVVVMVQVPPRLLLVRRAVIPALVVRLHSLEAAVEVH